MGAIAVTGYLLIGRDVRRRVEALPYSTVAYGSAAFVLLIMSLVTEAPLMGFGPLNWWVFVALALFPTLFGHTLFNWALRFVPASVVSVAFLGEPVGATLLAWLIWRTAPGAVSLMGGVLILLGIALFIREHKVH
jgi:drug/metabolite transporter (DMT)-like permease